VLPEGFAVGAAAVFGAVLVLAGLLIGRQLVAGDGAVEATDTSVAASAGTASDTVPPVPEAADGSEGAEGADTPEGDGGDTAGGGAAPSPGDVETVGCPAGVDEVICSAARFVEQARARPFMTFPEVKVVTGSELDQELLAGFEDYRADLERDEVLLKALGLLDPDLSLVEEILEMLEAGVLGFYDPEDDFLVVGGTDLGLFAQQVLVHELTHALDDQWFDLDRDSFADDDAEYAFNAVVEGNARRVEGRWRSELDSDQAAVLQQEELDALSRDGLNQDLGVPPIVRQLLASPYLDGATYVDHLLAAGGEEAVDAALTSPPGSSEEILHPGLDRSADPEIVVDPPPAGGVVQEEGRLGELLIRLWLGQLAGEGWGGDRYVTWVDASGSSCVAVDVVADTPEDLIDIETTAEGWVQGSVETRSIDSIVTASGQDGLRISGCL
jgi:hypothetical protein